MASTEPELVLRTALPLFLHVKTSAVETRHNLADTVSDIKEALATSAILTHASTFSLFYGDLDLTELDDFSVLSDVFEQKGTYELRLAEKAYTLKDVYDQVMRFRENIGMNFFDHAARAKGVASGGTRFGRLGLGDVKDSPEAESEKSPETAKSGEEAEKAGDSGNSNSSETEENKKSGETEKSGESKKSGETDKFELSSKDTAAISAIVGNLLAQKPATLSEIASSDLVLSVWKLPLKSLSISQWSVPQTQKARGDLLYLTITTLESETFTVTCHVLGFFVNRLSNANFDPSMKTGHKEYLLHHLMAAISPKFALTVEANKEAVSSGLPFAESYLIPSQASIASPWMVTDSQVKNAIVPDTFRAQVPLVSNGVDGADLVKDWNEEFQGIKEFPRDLFNERLLRDKLLNKYIQEFSVAAQDTAVEILRGNIGPLNPNERPEDHIFLRNNIFYSFGVNATGAHDETGGDEAARYCFGKDLATVRILNRLDVPGVCNLLTCVVDFLGQRVVCQAPVPGIFLDHRDENGEPIDKVVQGHSQDAGVVHSSEEFNKVLKPIGEALHLKSHKVKLALGAESASELALSKDTKGIIGTDQRKYIIDLYRSTPLDIEFLDEHFDGSESSYPHREASLRHDAVEEWYKRRAAALFKVETERLDKEGKLDGDEKPQVAIPVDQIVLNPDAFTGVNELEEDRAAVREVSSFIKKQLVPEFLDDVTKNLVPFDGAHLTAFMHRMGINMRYLGHIAKEAVKRVEAFDKETEEAVKVNKAAQAKKEEEEKEKKEEEKKEEKKKKEEKAESAAKLVPVKANMMALHSLAIQEMIARASKHVIRKLGKDVPFLLKPYLVAHFHNCLLGQKVNPNPSVEIDASLNGLFSRANTAFTQIQSLDVIQAVEKEVFSRFRFQLEPDWLDSIKPLSLMREIALKIGVQWKAQPYHFSKADFEAASVETPVQKVVNGSRKKEKGKAKKQETETPVAKRSTVFVADDIVAIVPIVKDSSYRCSMVDEIYETAKSHLNKGDAEIGTTLMTELISFYQQIYGSVNSEISALYSTLALFYAERKMTKEASIAARKAIVLNERVHGTDSYETINAYIKASFFDSLNQDQVSAFALNERAFQLWEQVYGDDHPNAVSTLTNFAAILQEMKLSKESSKLFARAIEVSEKLNGDHCDITALIRHRYAISLVHLGDYKGAQEQFTQAGDIFTKLVGPEDTLSKECANFVSQIETYIAYNQHLAAEQKKNEAGKKKQSVKKPVKAPVQKKGKKTQAPVSDPLIASKSVDEILQFIEGSQGRKKGKKN